MSILDVSRVPLPGEWVKQGRCYDKPELLPLFFPARGERTEAKDLCAECEVRVECLEYAVAHPSLQGVWGGTHHEERLKMTDRRSLRPRHQLRPRAYKAPAIPKDLLPNITETTLTREEYYQARGA
jgi:WhiB family redox-sensing transcriptional regulator